MVEEALRYFRLISVGKVFFYVLVFLEGGRGVGGKFIASFEIAFLEEQDAYTLPAPSIFSAKQVTCKPFLQREYL